MPRWRSGGAQLEDLLAELEAETGKPAQLSRNSRATFSPVEYEKMPAPIGVPINNELMNMSRGIGHKSNAKSGIGAFMDNVEDPAKEADAEKKG